MEKLKFVFLFLITIFIVPLYVLVGTTPAGAGTWPGLTEELCMADAFLLEPGNSLSQGALNCTANDVEITQVLPVNADEECTPGEVFTFPADIRVRTNARERWDTTFYLPLTDQSPQVVQGDNDNCSIVLPNAWDIEGAPVEADLDSDQCSDITKASGEDEYTLFNEPVTMLCTPDPIDPTRALFTYCAAWDNQERDNCTADADPYPGQIPNTKSKCKCDSFPINVFIKPPAPDIDKTLTSTDTYPEPGGVYTFTLGFTNPSSTSSIFISGLTDEVDKNQDNTWETSLNLWGATTVVGPSTPEGVYLTATNCPVPTGALYEVLPSTSYTCQISVHIVGTDLPNDQSPLFFDDVIKFVLEDKNGSPVTDGVTCPSGLSPVDGDHCSPIRTVNITNVPPTITVTKTPSTTEVLEPGGNVTFDVVVTSTSGSYDDPLVITELSDTDFGDLALYPGSTCATGGDLFLGSPYSCSFTAFIAGNAGDVHNNTVTAKAIDNENDEATASDGATVNINDVPSNITLTKTADPTEVLETGDDPDVFRDVDYTFEFCVSAAGVDDVTFSELEDEAPPESGNFFDLTADCSVDMLNGGAITPTPLLGFTLSPGDCASCEITMQLQGNAGDTYENLATIYGQDEDGQDVMASDDETVTFLNAPLDITPEFAIKARAFLRLTNGGVDNATITTLTIKSTNLVDGAGSVAAGFEILDETPTYSYETGDGPYEFCAADTVIAPGDTYECAFTIKLYPGFLPADGDVNFSALGLDGLAVTLEDDEGDNVTETIGIEVFTVE